MSAGDPAERLIVALDVPDLEGAKRLVGTLVPSVRYFKVGKELFTAAGPEVIGAIRSAGADVFLDLKFHDIPNTVGAACRAAVRLGVSMLNVHTLGGRAMMEAAASAVREEASALRVPQPLLLGVTVLTSLSGPELEEVGIPGPLDRAVERLARLASSSGLGGVVASPLEISLVRRAVFGTFTIVTPGVRPRWAAAGDQKRVATPAEAVRSGADHLVVGRPITQDPDPAEAARRVLDEIGSA